jgi:hypothetical protein
MLPLPLTPNRLRKRYSNTALQFRLGLYNHHVHLLLTLQPSDGISRAKVNT